MVQCRLIERVDDTTWRQVADACPWATFYHTPDWASIFSSAFPSWRTAPFGLEFSDGNLMVFPALRRPILVPAIGYWHESTVPGTYGGPISTGELTDEHTTALVRYVGKLPNLNVIGNPFAADSLATLGNTAGIQRRELYTLAVRLDGDYASVQARFSRGRRWGIKTARKAGFVVETTTSPEAWNEYYKVYLDQLSRWGRQAGGHYPEALFHAFAEAGRRSPAVRLWTVRLDSELVGGAIVLYHNRHVLGWHQAVLSRHLPAHPAELLMATVIENACQECYSFFDFGPSGGHSSVTEFKRHFGCERLAFARYRQADLRGRTYRAYRYARERIGLCPEV